LNIVCNPEILLDFVTFCVIPLIFVEFHQRLKDCC
jgi:hypothetical protein